MKPLSSKVALGTKLAAIVLPTFAIYYQDLTTVANEAIRSEPMSNILAMPFLFAYLIHRKRRTLRATMQSESRTTSGEKIRTRELVGALLCLLSFLLYWHGSYTFNPLEYQMISLPIFIAGLILVIFNSKTLRALAFPVAFLVFLVPPPLELLHTAGTTLSTASSEAAYTILRSVGLPVTLTWQYENPIITLTRSASTPIAFTVDVACSGLYSLTSYTIFAVFMAYIAKATPWKKSVIFVGGFGLIYALSIVRITVVVLLGAQSGMDIAIQVFHLLGSWVLIFTATLILLAISERILKMQIFSLRSKTVSCNHCSQNLGSFEYFCSTCGRILKPNESRLLRSDLSKIAIIAIAAILVTNLQVPVFALTTGPAEVITQTASGGQITTQILPSIPGYTTRFVYRDRRFEQIAKQDASLIYAYVPSKKSETTVWVTIEISKTRSSLHSWEVCLITWPLAKGYQPRVTQMDLKDVQILKNPPITARCFASQDKKSGVTQVVLYWYETSNFHTGQNLEQEHVKISLIFFANRQEDILATENKLLSFAEPLVNYWRPIKEWSQFSLLIAQNGNILIAATMAAMGLVLGYQIRKGREKNKANLRVYDKLASEEEKSILRGVHLARKGKASTSKIAECYQELTGRQIDLDVLTRKLKEAQEAGLITSEIDVSSDEPMIAWRSQIAF
jgi:exosortase